jgi:hypothetical protein
MKVGITPPNLGPQATRENVIQLATQAEKEGIESTGFWMKHPISSVETKNLISSASHFQNLTY